MFTEVVNPLNLSFSATATAAPPPPKKIVTYREKGFTDFTYAANFGMLEYMDLLVHKYGEDPNVPDANGDLPTTRAIKGDRPQMTIVILQKLKSLGANLQLPDQHKETPWLLAARERKELLKDLKKIGACCPEEGQPARQQGSTSTSMEKARVPICEK